MVQSLEESTMSQHDLNVAHDPSDDPMLKEGHSSKPPFRRQIVWFNAIGFLILHLVAVYAIFTEIPRVKLATVCWGVILGGIHSMGITMGAHRLYSHKAFKAKMGLRLALVTLQTMAGQNCMYIWVRDHRQHHKYSDTDGDPHNASRGFFFSHIGWLMSRKHPDVIRLGKTIDMSDIEADAFVMFQKKYYKILYFLLALTFPVAVPCLLWGENLRTSFLLCYVLRTIYTLNFTWLVNSAAHKFGNRPFSRDILPVENEFVSMFGLGEGWHNYHHSFPWDYKAAELGQRYNWTTAVLDKFAEWGWAYDLREASPAMVQHRIIKRGDGTHPTSAPADTEHEQYYSDSVKQPKAREALRRPGF